MGARNPHTIFRLFARHNMRIAHSTTIGYHFNRRQPNDIMVAFFHVRRHFQLTVTHCTSDHRATAPIQTDRLFSVARNRTVFVGVSTVTKLRTRVALGTVILTGNGAGGYRYRPRIDHRRSPVARNNFHTT